MKYMLGSAGSSGADTEGLGRLADHHRRPDPESVPLPCVLVDDHLVGSVRVGVPAVDEHADSGRTAPGVTGNNELVSWPSCAGFITARPNATSNGWVPLTSGSFATLALDASSKDGSLASTAAVGTPDAFTKSGTASVVRRAPGHTRGHDPERHAGEEAQQHPRAPPRPQVGRGPHAHRRHDARSDM